MDIQPTTSRLRRTFAYPTDSDTTSSSPADLALDEQEQEELISQLAAQNDFRNAQFRRFLFLLPILSTIPYFISLFHPSGRVDAMVAMLALSSLGSTGWMLYRLPPGVTGVALLDAWIGGPRYGSNSSSGLSSNVGGEGSGSRRNHRGRRSSFSFAQEPHRSPLETYLPYLNIGLCAVLILTGLLSKPHAPQSWGHVGLGNLPAVVYAVVLAAKAVMGGVDPEKELSELKYEYKGA
ncbi:uncharacterized protein BCR38DRAFT_434971 [Pseudomassariella vexata]|uniref:Uncharacterized protein n=1 Tax=Pseudomassariella vexata TaxID=1141098 RepID=A0A1Y2DYV8_9PEZI|nr:uncharacterized protein BCR38DRAFT_434971 [Pseudomassariella vexata]ORY64399.1 hypothetical protein BCR38DRAFT_434971 [Pseudomassariella vexata]